MMVWIVLEYDYDTCEVVGVYDSFEKAETKRAGSQLNTSRYVDFEVVECEVK